MICDTMIKNANIITMNEAMPIAAWMAIRDGKIAALGQGAQMPEARHVLDAGRRTILPGFIDSHVHGTLTGEALHAVDLSDADTTGKVLDQLAGSTGSGGMITAHSFSREHFHGALFTAENLDEISRDKIILIYDKSYHGCYLNTCGIKAAGIRKDMPGVTVKEGNMTGEITDDVSYYRSLRNIMRTISEDVIRAYMQAVSDYALSKGVTTIHSLDGNDFEVDMPAWILYRDQLDLHVVNYWETMDFDKVEPYDLGRIGGCICLDGTRSLHTMALMEPYRDNPAVRGLLYYRDQDVLTFIRTAHERNMQCAMHATGPRAIDQYIYLLYQVIQESGQKDLRHRIEHFSYPTEKHIEMAVQLKLALPMQPAFFKTWDDGENSLYRQRFGAEEADRIEPIADIVAAGGMVCGGSDSPVTQIDPLAGIDACVNSSNPHRKLSLMDAIRIFTYNGAWAAHEETVKGSLKPGKDGDFIVLEKNPMENEKDIGKISVEKTFVQGKLVYQRGK